MTNLGRHPATKIWPHFIAALLLMAIGILNISTAGPWENAMVWFLAGGNLGLGVCAVERFLRIEASKWSA